MSDARRLHLGVTPWAAEGDALRDLIRQARFAETLGFDSFFLPESHLHPAARPSPLITLAALAGATERIRLGTTSLLLPLRHPLLLAEEIASLDRLSGGRLILGLGRGFRRATFEAFGVDSRTKRDRFEQVLATMLRAWGVEPWWPGAPAAPAGGVPLVEPTPLQQPHPPLWIAAFGPKAIAQAARLGLPYFASPMEPIEVVEENLARYRSDSRSRGVQLMRTAFVSDDNRLLGAAQEAIRRETEALAARSGMSILRLRPAAPAGGPAVATLVGSPRTVAGAIGELVQRLEVDHLVVRTPGELGRAATEHALHALAELPRPVVRP